MSIFVLPDLQATERLGRAFASCIRQRQRHIPLFLSGQLGAGKTTFVRALVQDLPGSAQAEISSPSFALLNLYPTHPEVGHFDLYRSSGLGFGEDLEEILWEDGRLCLVEWAEYLPESSRPEDALWMQWEIEAEKRRVSCQSTGPKAEDLLACVFQIFTAS